MQEGERAESGLDAIARDLASGRISRRTALKRFAGATFAALIPGALLSDPALASCPQSRRCSGRCCPNHAHCRHGKCKCRKGFTRCGKHCRHLETDVKNCGSCGHRCPSGKVCHNGHCKPGTQQTCGNGIVEPGEDCDDGNTIPGDGCSANCTVEQGWNCTGSPSVCTPICGDGLVVGGEVCDGANLNGQTCVTLGYASGTLACAPGCQGFDTSNCVAPSSCGDAIKNGDETDVDCGGSCSPCANGMSCLGNTDCSSGLCSGGTCIACASNQDCGGTGSPICSEQVCMSGVCQTRVTDGEFCNVISSGCPAGEFRDLCCSAGLCTMNCGICTT